MASDAARPSQELLRVPVRHIAMGAGHVGRVGGIAITFPVPLVQCDAALAKVDLHHVPSIDDTDLLPYVFEEDTVMVLVLVHVDVRTLVNGAGGILPYLVGLCGQGARTCLSPDSNSSERE